MASLGYHPPASASARMQPLQAQAEAEAHSKVKAQFLAQVQAKLKAAVQAQAQATAHAQEAAQAKLQHQAQAHGRAHLQSKLNAQTPAQFIGQSPTQIPVKLQAQTKNRVHVEELAKPDVHLPALGYAQPQVHVQSPAQAQLQTKHHVQVLLQTLSQPQGYAAQIQPQAHTQVQPRLRPQGQTTTQVYMQSLVPAKVPAPTTSKTTADNPPQVQQPTPIPDAPTEAQLRSPPSSRGDSPYHRKPGTDLRIPENRPFTDKLEVGALYVVVSVPSQIYFGHGPNTYPTALPADFDPMKYEDACYAGNPAGLREEYNWDLYWHTGKGVGTLWRLQPMSSVLPSALQAAQSAVAPMFSKTAAGTILSTKGGTDTKKTTSPSSVTKSAKLGAPATLNHANMPHEFFMTSSKLTTPSTSSAMGNIKNTANCQQQEKPQGFFHLQTITNYRKIRTTVGVVGLIRVLSIPITSVPYMTGYLQWRLATLAKLSLRQSAWAISGYTHARSHLIRLEGMHNHTSSEFCLNRFVTEALIYAYTETPFALAGVKPRPILISVQSVAMSFLEAKKDVVRSLLVRDAIVARGGPVNVDRYEEELKKRMQEALKMQLQKLEASEARRKQFPGLVRVA